MFRRKSLTFQPPVRSIRWAFERRLPYGNQRPRLLAFISTFDKKGGALHHRHAQLCSSSGLVTSRVPDEGRPQVSFVLRQRSSTLSTLSTLSKQQSSIDDIVANSTSITMSASALLDTQAAAPAGSSHSPLWSPLTIPPNKTRTFAFLRSINDKYSLRLSNYEDLWKWSVDHPSEFWDAVWDDTDVLGVKGQRGAGVPSTATPAQNPAWFPDAKLNWAENMLRRRDDKVALIQATEPTPTSPTPTYRRCTYAQLYELTSQAFHALRKAGVGAGDRVASYASNCIENVAAALATSAIGGIWVSVSADFGPDAALSRFQQVQPKVIFTVDETTYNAKVHNHLPKVETLLSALKGAGQEPKVVVISSSSSSLTGDAGSPKSGWNEEWITWKAFLESGSGSGEIEWFRGGFDWPLWILFSSGTTNKPKPIVHRAGGMLLQSKKEFVIQADLKEDDVFFYYTTTGWMMWNFLVNALSTGCTLVLYDGSPLKDPSLLWRMTDELGITIFGTSAKYIDQLSRDYKPKDHHSLSTLRQIHSTGSPLAAHLFDWVYENIKKDVLLASITGGTDICSLFAGMSTALPVYRSELQCRMLGMAVESYTSDGKPTRPGQSGELVCTKPFPCQPLGFWPLPGYGPDDEVKAAQERYRQSYFDEFPDIWYHGDHVLITESREGNGGGVIMLGRSDGVLNPGGIRFGSSEIYNVLDAAFSPSSAHHIVDSLVVGQAIQGGVDERVVLFVKLADGRVLDDALRKAVKTEVRARRTARHVPEKILQVSDIPYTLNAKKVEVPIKKILNGVSVDAVNVTTLRNPECLAEYVKIGEVLRKEIS